jgi:hypothetical protein
MAFNRTPLQVSLADLAKAGPVRTIPKMEPEDSQLKRQDIEAKIRTLRELAAVGQTPAFLEYVREEHAKSIKYLLFKAKTDAERLEGQVYARIWTGIFKDLVTAAEQVLKLEELLRSISGQKA